MNIFAVYKPVGMTSHDVVDRVRKITGVKRVGHGGTLDPLAEGVLVIAIGRENTKLLEQYVKGEKEYVATIKLGEVSETDDSEGPIQSYKDPESQSDKEQRCSEKQVVIPAKAGIQKPLRASNLSNSNPHPNPLPTGEGTVIPSLHNIQKALHSFIGIIQQTPPQYSAMKVNGKRAYKGARKGQKMDLKPREVVIHDIEILSYEFPFLVLRVTTGPGVYIRSLARDLGESLNVGGYIFSLKRTRVASFSEENAIKLDKLPGFLVKK